MSRRILVPGAPNPKQKEFFACRSRYVAYGGARGGGKSWALRRKLIALCLRYPGIRCLILRRTLAEVKANHLTPILSELSGAVTYSERDRTVRFPSGSSIRLGYLASAGDLLQYQGQEFDIIAMDEATQFPEAAFTALKACLRGTARVPRRMYLTCNPGGIGHAWVKRLFVDRDFREDECPDDYRFIRASVFDNPALTEGDPSYVKQLRSLPPKLRDAWLYGRWDAFEGQFFPEFDPRRHVLPPPKSGVPGGRRFIALDYGFDLLAALWVAVQPDGSLFVYRELCRPGLTIGEAAKAVADATREPCEYTVASPDLWNRRQDTGLSGVEIMSRAPALPPLRRADDRRIPGWRALREYLSAKEGFPSLGISSDCPELIRCMGALLFSSAVPEDAADEPHSVTHCPEALRYAVMSRAAPPQEECRDSGFRFSRRTTDITKY